MTILRPPHPVPADAFARSLFLAGGITGAPDWQSELCEALGDTDLTLLNPRREGYNSLDPNALREQIAWEHDGLRGASAISFWFPPDALCLISLFELGAWSHWRDANGKSKPLFVAVHPDYTRRENITIQLQIERPDVQIVLSLAELKPQIVSWAMNAKA